MENLNSLNEISCELYHEEASIQKYQGSCDRLFSFLEKAASGQTSEIPEKYKFFVDEFKSNYKTWKDLDSNTRLREMFQNIQSLIKLIRQKSSS